MQTRFLLSDGRSIYAPYCKSQERSLLKRELENGIQMFCGCNRESPLYYGISSDLRFIPLHKHYVHKTWCSRFDNEKRSGAVVYDEEGGATVYTSFKPGTFTMTSEKTDTCERSDLELQRIALRQEIKEKEKERLEALGVVKEEKESLPSLNLQGLIRFLNHETYMERIAAGKFPYLSEEYFMAALHGYLRTVRLNGMKKTLKDITLKEDKMQFFYTKLDEISEKGISYPGYGGNMVRRFVPLGIMAKAEEAFVKKYEVCVQEYMETATVMVAGFVYERLNRHGAAYRCVGRVCFFPVTEYGLCVDSILERDIVTCLMRVCRRSNGLFLYPEDEKENTVGILRNNSSGKEAAVFFKRKGKGYEGDFFACNGQVPSEEEIEAFLVALG